MKSKFYLLLFMGLFFSGITSIAQTACPAPSGLNATSITTTSAMLNWSLSNMPATYTLKYKASNAQTWTVVSAQSNSCNLGSLTPLTTYEYVVQAICAIGNNTTVPSNPSVTATFATLGNTTSCLTPTGITLASINSNSAVLAWTAVQNAYGYHVRYRIANSNANWTLNFAQTHTYNFSNLLPSTNYEYEVQTVCSTNPLVTSQFSSTGYFVTQGNTQTCMVPNNINANNILNNGATISWGAMQNVFGYHVRYRIFQSNSSWTMVLAQTNSMILSGLLASTKYEYEVQTVCSNLNGVTITSPFSSTLNFTTLGGNTGCVTPTQTLANNITNNSAKLNWAAVTGVALYNVKYRVLNTISWTALTTQSPFVVLNSLSSLTSYEWAVQAVCNNNPSGGVSTWTTASIFITTGGNNTACSTPTGLSSTNITFNGAKLLWAAINSASTYNVRYRIANNSTSNWTSVLAQTNFMILSNLQASTHYEFQIQAICGIQNGIPVSSLFSVSGFFQTTAVVLCATPTNLTSSNVNTTNATLNWSASNALSYNIKYRPLSPNTNTNWTSTTSNTNSKIISGLTAGNQYEWMVQAMCASNTNNGISSVWSASSVFATPVQIIMGPNPAGNNIQLIYNSSTPQNINLNLLDFQGKSVINQNNYVGEGENKLEMQTNSIQNGIYFLEVYGNEGRQVKKVYIDK